MVGTPIATLFARVTADTAQFDSKMRGVDQEMKRGSKSLRAAGAVAKTAVLGVAALGVAVGGVGSKLVSMGSDAEEMMGKFDIVFGDQAGGVVAKMDEMGRALNRNTYDLRGFAAGFQDTFVPLGFARDEAAEMSTQLTQLTVDMASFNNASEPDVMAALQSALVGNHETMRQYGVIITQATLDQELMNMGIEDGVKSASEQEKVMARLNIIMAGTSDAQGDASRTAGSWANQMRGLRATLNETATAMGAELLPQLTPLLTKGSEFIRRVAPMVIEKFSQMVDAIANFEWSWNGVTTWASGIWNAIRPKLNEQWTAIKSWITDPARRTEFASAVEKAWTGITTWASNVWGNISPILTDTWKSLTSWISDPMKRAEMMDNIGAAWTGFTEWAGAAWGNIQPNLSQMWTDLVAWISAHNEPLGQALGGWGDKFDDLGLRVADLKRVWNEQFPEIRRITVDNGGQISESFTRMMTSFQEFYNMFTGIEGDFKFKWVEFLVSMYGAVSRVSAGVIGSLLEMTNALLTFATAIGHLAGGDLEAMRHELAGLGEILDRLGDLSGIGDIWDLVTGAGQQQSRSNVGASSIGASSIGASSIGTRSLSTGEMHVYLHAGSGTMPTDHGALRELARALGDELSLTGAMVTAI
jgi:hypothetical protein